MRSIVYALGALALLCAGCGGGTVTVTDADDAGNADAHTDATSDAGAEASTPETPPALPDGYTAVPFLAPAPVREFTASTPVLQPNQDYVAVLQTSAGRIVLDLYEVETPTTVNSFVFLALHRFYEGVLFHRVIDEFMAQTGDPNTVDGRRSQWGRGGAGYSFGLEVLPSLTFDGPGVLGMARANDPNSNSSQFFITLAAADFLDQEYTVWGKVIEGLEHLPQIARGEPPQEPTRIERVHIATKPR